MKKIKILITGIVMIGTILVAGLAHAATTNVTITFDVESVAEIVAGGCSTGLSLSVLASQPSGYGTDSQNCEFQIRANMPWDLEFHEYNGGSGLQGTYESDIRYNALFTTDPSIIADCVEVAGVCDLTTAFSGDSQFGVWFTDGTTGSQTLTPSACSSQSLACALDPGNTQLFNEYAKTTSSFEGINLNLYAAVDENITANSGYLDSIEISIVID